MGGSPPRERSHPYRGDTGPPGRHPAPNLERLLPGPGSQPGGGGKARASHHSASGPHRAQAAEPGGTEQAVRRGWDEPPRGALRRHVCGAAAGAGTEHEFFDQLAVAGVLVRKRNSTLDPGQVTGYAVGLPHHRSSDDGVIRSAAASSPLT